MNAIYYRRPVFSKSFDGRTRPQTRCLEKRSPHVEPRVAQGQANQSAACEGVGDRRAAPLERLDGQKAVRAGFDILEG